MHQVTTAATIRSSAFSRSVKVGTTIITRSLRVHDTDSSGGKSMEVGLSSALSSSLDLRRRFGFQRLSDLLRDALRNAFFTWRAIFARPYEPTLSRFGEAFRCPLRCVTWSVDDCELDVADSKRVSIFEKLMRVVVARCRREPFRLPVRASLYPTRRSSRRARQTRACLR